MKKVNLKIKDNILELEEEDKAINTYISGLDLKWKEGI